MPEQTFDVSRLEQTFHLAIETFDFRVMGGFAPYQQYLELLLKWNQAYNLTAIRDPISMLFSHVLESLAVSPYTEGEECLDVGTGAGVPGLLLAIANPGQFWTLLDSNIKKTRFVSQVVMELGLKNVDVVHKRIEEFDEQGSFDSVICRAFTSLSGFYQSCLPFIKTEGKLLAMKAAFPKEEIAGLKKHTENLAYHQVKVPGVDKPCGLVVFS